MTEIDEFGGLICKQLKKRLVELPLQTKIKK